MQTAQTHVTHTERADTQTHAYCLPVCLRDLTLLLLLCPPTLTLTRTRRTVRAGFGAREAATAEDGGLPSMQILVLVGILLAVLTAMQPTPTRRTADITASKPAAARLPPPPPPPAL
jgi:hypothetical protein